MRFIACWLLALCVPAFAAEAPSGIDLDTLLAPESFSSMEISPDGKHLVAIRFDGRRNLLFLLDAQTLAAQILAYPHRAENSQVRWTRQPVRAHWISADIVAVDYSDDHTEAVDLRSGATLVLGERFIRTRREKSGAPSDWVLVFHDLGALAMSQVNVRTGERRKYRISLPGRPVEWAFDANGALRAVTMMDTALWSDKTRVSNWYRADERSEWELLSEGAVTEDTWAPLHVPSEPDSLIVHSRHQRDTAAIFRYDTRKREHAEVLAGHPSQDILGATGLEQARFDSVITEGLKPQIHWFDARWAALQTSVDAALPNRINQLSGDPRGRLLIHSYADVDPGRWYVLDTNGMKMWHAATFRPKVDSSQMLPMATIQYRALDGLAIPAYLTRPAAGGAPAPLVVLIHGGPHLRDRWKWDEEVQVLATSGYAVFQPQFRGSTGFGRRFETAGYGQWGRAMQDDISAGVKYLVEQKIADPQRICIVGASYGGYAALWGLVKTPELYRCGISFAGVSDIEHMLKDWSDRNADAAVREFQRSRIGNPAQDVEQLDQVSPLKHAARIQVPLLLAHGEDDKRVPISHSRKMMAALTEHGKPFEWLMFEEEGHGLYHIKNRRRYYEAVLAFLSKHIGAAAAAGSAPQQSAASTR